VATDDARKPLVERLTLREYALLAIAFGAALLAALSVLLHFLGTRWRPGVRSLPGRNDVAAEILAQPRAVAR
jgi:hypothetical protein